MTQADKARRLLADSEIPLAEVATQLGHSTYAGFAAWTRRQFGKGPREIREGKPARLGRGAASSEGTASATWQTRVTPSERETIAAAVPALAERWGCSHGAAVARAVSDAVAKKRAR